MYHSNLKLQDPYKIGLPKLLDRCTNRSLINNYFVLQVEIHFANKLYELRYTFQPITTPITLKIQLLPRSTLTVACGYSHTQGINSELSYLFPHFPHVRRR